jgi:hypothetical protein
MSKKKWLVIIVIVAAAVLLLASSCSAPTIVSLEAEPDWTAPLDSLQVICIASDPDGSELSYEWSISGGNITGTGLEVTWTAPEDIGMYDITVVVTNSQGKKDTESMALFASNGPPPIIEDLIVTAKGHEYLKKVSTWYQAAKTKEYEIECIASDTDGEPSELVYEWSCDGGEISGEGSTIIWTAPNTAGDITVAVKVLDDAGNWVRKSIVFKVVQCESCVFW